MFTMSKPTLQKVTIHIWHPSEFFGWGYDFTGNSISSVGHMAIQTDTDFIHFLPRTELTTLVASHLECSPTEAQLKEYYHDDKKFLGLKQSDFSFNLYLQSQNVESMKKMYAHFKAREHTFSWPSYCNIFSFFEKSDVSSIKLALFHLAASLANEQTLVSDINSPLIIEINALTDTNMQPTLSQIANFSHVASTECEKLLRLLVKAQEKHLNANQYRHFQS